MTGLPGSAAGVVLLLYQPDQPPPARPVRPGPEAVLWRRICFLDPRRRRRPGHSFRRARGMESSTTKRWHLLGTGVLATPPDEFAEYRLLRPLGESSDSRVYLARDTLLDRLVALKFVHAADRRSLDHFLVEARAAARIQHPNIATLYRVGRVDEGAYLVSEYVRGQPLASIARPVEFPRVLEMACDLSRGLAAAHRRGVLHCDLNPANVLVTDEGQIKIIDFGLARLLLPTAAVEEQPERPLFGTPYHIPPEAWRG